MSGPLKKYNYPSGESVDEKNVEILFLQHVSGFCSDVSLFSSIDVEPIVSS